MNRRPVLLFLALLIALTACRAETPQAGMDADSTAQAGTPASTQGRLYERAVVFLTSVGDSTLIVPWLFSARTKPGGVDRVARAWLARGGAWEEFLVESWETPPTRVPWRLHPRGPLRLVVGDGEGIEALRFEEGPRRLEVQMGATRSEWSGAQGETFLVADGAAVLSERRLPGLVLDLARASRGDAAQGDWMFLTSGDSLQIVLSAAEATVGGSATFQGWGRLPDDSEVPWRGVTVRWTETRSFEKARREVPARWALEVSDEMSGNLEMRTAHIEAGEGEGPLLPVDALFEVAGTLRIGRSTYPLRGLVRHVQR